MDLSLTQLLENSINFFFIGIKNWGGLHPFVIHFPIVFLLIAPVFMILGLAVPKFRTSLYLTALALLALGTLGAYLAVWTGEAAAEPLPVQPKEILKTLDAHYRLGEQVRFDFTILTGLFVAYLLGLPKLTAKLPRKALTAILTIYLFAYCSALLVLLNAAHYGGKLVHQHGIRSTLYTIPETE